MQKKILAAALLVLALGLAFVFWKAAAKPRGEEDFQRVCDISVSVNGSVPGRAAKGRPLIIGAAFTLPPDLGMPLEITRARGGWAGTAEISVTDAQGREQPWPLERAAVSVPDGDTLRLSALETAFASWLLGAGEVSRLAEGTYAVRVTLKDRKRRLIAESAPLEFKLEPPAAEGPDADRETMLIEAEYHRLRGDAPAQEKAVRGFLEKYPEDGDGLAVLAQILRGQGKAAEALAAVSKISDLFPEDTPLPRHLAKLRHELLIEAMKAAEAGSADGARQKR